MRGGSLKSLMEFVGVVLALAVVGATVGAMAAVGAWAFVRVCGGIGC